LEGEINLIEVGKMLMQWVVLPISAFVWLMYRTQQDHAMKLAVLAAVHEAKKALVKPGAPKKPDEWKASVVITDEDYADDLEAFAIDLMQ